MFFVPFRQIDIPSEPVEVLICYLVILFVSFPAMKKVVLYWEEMWLYITHTVKNCWLILGAFKSIFSAYKRELHHIFQ